MASPTRAWLRRHPVASFLLLAFTWSWGYDALVYLTVGPQPGILVRGVVRTWGPLLAAGLVTWAIGGSVREWAGQVTRWRLKPRWYLFAIAVPLVLEDGLLVSAIHLLAGGPVQLAPSPWWHYVANFLVVLLLAGSLEEFGWRGFAQPRLQERTSAFTAAVGIGVVWALWHLPLFYLYDVPAYDPSQFWTTYLWSLVVSSVVFAWLYNGSGGSLILPMLAHALGNLPAVVAPVGELGPAAEYTVQIGGLMLVVALLVVYGRQYIARSPPDPLVPGDPPSAASAPE